MSEQKFETWGIVEVMGHSRFAGFITQAEFPAGFLRVTVPPVGDKQGFDKILAPGAIYAITPTDEETARTAAAVNCSEPLNAWELKREYQRTLPDASEPQVVVDTFEPRPDPDDFDDDDEFEPL